MQIFSAEIAYSQQCRVFHHPKENTLYWNRGWDVFNIGKGQWMSLYIHYFGDVFAAAEYILYSNGKSQCPLLAVIDGAMVHQFCPGSTYD